MRVKRLVISLIKIWKMLKFRPVVCRFYPSCSEYTMQAVEKYGAVFGIYLGIKRVLRCHPFHPGGYDPLR